MKSGKTKKNKTKNTMIITNSSYFSFSTLFKNLFILFLIIVNLFIIYNENKIEKSQNKKINNVKTAGMLDSSIIKTLKNFGAGIAPAATIYGASIAFKQENVYKKEVEEKNKKNG